MVAVQGCFASLKFQALRSKFLVRKFSFETYQMQRGFETTGNLP